MTTENEFATTTAIQSTNPGADAATIGANTALGGLFGFNQNIQTARGVMIAQDVNGQHLTTVFDYNRNSENQLMITERTIGAAIYDQLSTSFDRLIPMFDNTNNNQ